MAANETYDNGLIVAVGVALWGETAWQAQMARALGVHKDTVQDWRQGRSRPRAPIAAELLRLCDERVAGIAEVRERLLQEVSAQG